jgi:hypothetical protein
MLRRRPVVRTVARTAVIAGTATAVSGRVSRRQAARAAPEPEPAPAAPAPSAGPTPDAIDQLKELAELKDQGVLTEEEFAAQKAKILGS